ncbi:MAG: thioredoxin family protein [Bdellovibrionales bacterium]
MEEINSHNKEKVISEKGNKVLFFWGHNCPNCEIAKKVIQENIAIYKSLDIRWYHANLYLDFDLAHDFGVHGIPVFFIYQNEKKLGRITSFPGHDQFLELLSKL